MSATLVAQETDLLIANLQDAVRLGDPASVTRRIQSLLEDVLSERRLQLPDRFRRPAEGRYARRLLFRDEELDWTAVVMTWAPGQKTPLHDHDGSWCVEGVVEGEIEVTMYDHLDEDGGLHQFRRKHTLHATPGEAGALIPPYEHHVLGNSSSVDVAVTLHVYEGKMARCSTFLPVDTDADLGESVGWYRQESKTLGYDE